MAIYELALIFVAIFFVALFIVWLISNCGPKKKPDNSVEEIDEEVKLLRVTILEVNSEKKIFDNGLDQRIESLEKLNKREFSPNFFKPDNKPQSSLFMVQNSHIKELNNSLKAGLNDYPEFSLDEASQVSYVAAFRQKYLEHHAHIGDLAREYFKVLDEYLIYLANVTEEPIQLAEDKNIGFK